MTPQDAWLTAYFQSAAGAHCPACAAPLAGSSSACPRCRRHFTVGLAAAGHYRLAWAIALACLLLIVGISIIVDMALIVRHGQFTYRSLLFHMELYTLSLAGLLASIGTLLLLRGRKRFCGWPALSRHLLLAGLCAAVVVECLILASLDH